MANVQKVNKKLYGQIEKPAKMSAKNAYESTQDRHINAAIKEVHKADMAGVIIELLSYLLKEMKHSKELPKSWTGANILDMIKILDSKSAEVGGKNLVDEWLDQINSDNLRKYSRDKLVEKNDTKDTYSKDTRRNDNALDTTTVEEVEEQA